MSQNFKIVYQPPTPEEYCELRKLCGLGPRTVAAATIALPRSLFAICLRSGEENQLIAMGRVVGDLGSHVQVCDIAVRPEHQKKGYSKIILENIRAFIKREVPECAFVNLFADVDFLYQKFGFEYTVAKGMYLVKDFTPPLS